MGNLLNFQDGSLALGSSAVASGAASVQIGPGTNSAGTSLQLSSEGVRIFGGLGNFGTRNGDMFVNAAGTVLAFSKGSVQDICAAGGGGGAFTADGSFAAFQGTGAVTNTLVGQFAQGSNATAVGNWGVFAQGSNATAAGSRGTFAQGSNVYSNGHEGCFTQGMSLRNTGICGAVVIGLQSYCVANYGAVSVGDHAFNYGNQGLTSIGSRVRCEGSRGLFASGYRSSSVGKFGVFAMGYKATAVGSNSCFAMGSQATSLANGAIQFGSGFNSAGTSLQLSSEGIRIFGGLGNFGTRNGDMFVNAAGTVLAFSKGSVQDICAAGGGGGAFTADGTMAAWQGTDAVTNTQTGQFAQGNEVSAVGNRGSFAQGNKCIATADMGCFGQGFYVRATGARGCFSQGYHVSAGGAGGCFAQGSYAKATGANGCFAQGLNVTATAASSWAVGTGAVSTSVGKITRSSGKFLTDGDAQYSDAIFRKQTTTDAEIDLTLDGALAQLIIPTDTTWTFSFFVVARRLDARDESAGYKIEGVIDNNNATVALVGTQSKTVLAEDTSAWDVNVYADNAGKALVIKVIGENAKTIDWVARVSLVEVTAVPV